MARSDLLIELVRAGSKNDSRLFRKTVEELAAEERAKQHHVLADRLLAQLNSHGTSQRPIFRSPEREAPYFMEINPQLTLKDLILSRSVLSEINELVEEQIRADLLRSHNLEPRHRILLAGPPGNGKTSLAEAIAEALMVPLIVIRYDMIIASFLGETANRLRILFDQVRSRRCVVFFDEFDVLGKERGDIHETGEIKRVVSSLLLQIDDLPSYTVIVTATNHPELLDRAVWRRFQLRLSLLPPTAAQVSEWVERFEARFETPLGLSRRALTARLTGLSYSDLEAFGLDVQRRYILSRPSPDLKAIVQSRLDHLSNRFEPHFDERLSGRGE